MKTYMAKPNEIERKWWVIDAQDKVLGRIATEAARILRGKHRPQYTPHVDTGEYVIIINADKVALTGKKLEQKQYIRHSGHPGGIKMTSYETMLQKNPELIVTKAITGMLPHNTLGRNMAKKLKVYKGSEHPHDSQKPEVWPL